MAGSPWDTRPVSRQECSFLSLFLQQIHRPVDTRLSHRESQGHPAGVPVIFLSLCALLFPDISEHTKGSGHGKIDRTGQVSSIGNPRQTSKGGNELFDHHPFRLKTPTPPGSLRTPKVNLCALLLLPSRLQWRCSMWFLMGADCGGRS